LSVADAAELFTIEVGQNANRVTPDLPTFMRPFSGEDGRNLYDSDARFHDAERVGALWAAGALMQSPVVNRPGPFGFSGRCMPSSSLTALSCGEFDGRSEVYFRNIPAGMGIDSELIDDIEQHRFVSSSSPDLGVYRSRNTSRLAGYYPVAVVGQTCFPCLENSRLLSSLAGRSVEVMGKLELSFAILFWGILADDTAVLAGVAPWPSLPQFGNQGEAIVDCLVGLLCDPS
jgi:hypothetical protein